MYFYFINLFFLSILVLLEVVPIDGQNRHIPPKLLVMLGLGYLCFLAMFRGISVGNDTYDYATYFYRIARQSDIFSYIRSARFEPGYILLNWTLSKFFKNHQIILITSSVFSFYSVGRFFLKHSKHPAISVYLFFTLMSFDFFLCAIRQELAIAVLLFAYDALLDYRALRYMLLVLLAAMFHYSALIFIPVYFLMAIRQRQKFYIVLLATTFITMVGFQQILSWILSFFTNYESYSDSSYFQSGVKLSLILYLVVYLYILLTGEWVGMRNPSGMLHDEMEYRLVVLLPVLCMISFNAPIFTRFLRYFQMFIYLYFPNALYKKDSQNQFLLLVTTMILSAAYALLIHIFRTPTWFTSYPYSFFWNN